jgi:hypothetical protein
MVEVPGYDGRSREEQQRGENTAIFYATVAFVGVLGLSVTAETIGPE